MGSIISRRWWRAALLLLLLVLCLPLGGWLLLRASLPPLDGRRHVDGPSRTLSLERDALGSVTVRASSFADFAFGVGFAHGQDRFFQMDLTRRSSAGELSELFGPVALEADRRARRHGFRSLAVEVVRRCGPSERRQLDSYAQGVQAGLASLRVRPFEYLVLRARPRPWTAEDTILVLLAMYRDLQDEDNQLELDRELLATELPAELVAFLDPAGGEWDAPLQGEPLAPPPIPDSNTLDLRRTARRWGIAPEARSDRFAAAAERAEHAGSNAWAVGGKWTQHGGALLAGDMHLGLRVPATWYRTTLAAADGADSLPSRLTGLSLPGAPAIVVGSNGFIAWSFTNSYGDWLDWVRIELDPDDPERYRTPGGWHEFGVRREIISVRSAEPDTLELRLSVWGPVLAQDANGRPLALRWTAHDPEAVNLLLLRMGRKESVPEALALAARCGIPQQNFIVADRDGRVGWTLAGRIPRRRGFDGRQPRPWSSSPSGWDGYHDPSEQPVISMGPEGRLWSANARAGDGKTLQWIGDGGYALGARAQHIRDALFSRNRFDEQEMLALQLDDRAVFLRRWRDLLLRLTDSSASPRASELQTVVRATAERAGIESAGYRLVREFREQVLVRTMSPLLEEAGLAAARFDPRALTRVEIPLWTLVKSRPLHLLPAAYSSWDVLLEEAVEATLALVEPDQPLRTHTWGQRNRLRMQHPLSRALPLLGRWLDMPSAPLPGDRYMPRVSAPSFAASERLVVAPGREERGILHVPGGQSGHPLSGHYRDQHRAWLRGEPVPLLPGPAEHVLELVPASR